MDSIRATHKSARTVGSHARHKNTSAAAIFVGLRVQRPRPAQRCAGAPVHPYNESGVACWGLPRSAWLSFTTVAYALLWGVPWSVVIPSMLMWFVNRYAAVTVLSCKNAGALGRFWGMGGLPSDRSGEPDAHELPTGIGRE